MSLTCGVAKRYCMTSDILLCKNFLHNPLEYRNSSHSILNVIMYNDHNNSL